MPKISLPTNAEARAEDAYERFGTRQPHCSVAGCAESDWRALTGTDPDIKCYEHSCVQRGRSVVERHHPAGRINDPDMEVTMAANDHRIIDSYKADWPEETRLNPEGSPALRAAANLRSARDWLVMIAERLLAPVIAWLEALEKCMRKLHGPRWWEALGLPDMLTGMGVEL
ncbi:MAG: hypothetical protein ACYC0L_03050 [Thermoleophilia bacterium]